MALASILIASGLMRCAPETPAPPADEADLRNLLHVAVHLRDRTLIAAGAVADSFETGVRRVTVRVVERMDVEIRFEVDRAVTLPMPPRLCLVGPFSAPDDAGLSDRCWGEPDLGQLAAAQSPVDGAGGLRLVAGHPMVLPAALRRGHARCDYPPGTWRLEVSFSPPGTAPGPARLDLEDVAFEVPFDSPDPLLMLAPGDTRYCGLANVVFRDQGEPLVVTSAVSPTEPPGRPPNASPDP